jgi:lysophospholipase L1-like esterase
MLVGSLSLSACSSPTTPTTIDPGAPKLTCAGSMSVLSPLGAPIAINYPSPVLTGGLPPVAGPICAPLSGSTLGPGANQVNCTVADAKQRIDSCTFTITVTLPPKLTMTRFLAFGDSITWGEDGSNSPTQNTVGAIRVRPRVQLRASDTYPGALQAELAAWYTLQSPQVRNAGNPGEAVTDPTTFPRFTSYTLSGQYDALLLMEGANDLANQDNPAVIAGLGLMIDNAKSRGMRTFLATIPPENANGCCPSDRGTHSTLVPGFNDQVKFLAAAKGVSLVDVYQAFGGDLSLIGPDGLHPTASGYHLIADTFFGVIKQTLEASPTATAIRTHMPEGFFVQPTRR